MKIRPQFKAHFKESIKNILANNQNEKILNSTVNKSGYETITNTTYIKDGLKISVDTVEIQGVKTARIKKGFIDNKLIRTVIHVFDSNGRFREKYTLPSMQTVQK